MPLDPPWITCLVSPCWSFEKIEDLLFRFTSLSKIFEIVNCIKLNKVILFRSWKVRSRPMSSCKHVQNCHRDWCTRERLNFPCCALRSGIYRSFSLFGSFLHFDHTLHHNGTDCLSNSRATPRGGGFSLRILFAFLSSVKTIFVDGI